MSTTPEIDAEIARIAATIKEKLPVITAHPSDAASGQSKLELKTRQRSLTIAIQDNSQRLSQRGGFG